MPDLSWNLRLWNKAWPADGDEWDDCPRFIGIPYAQWKDSLARTFLIANLNPSSQVLEIGPGHGRWSEFIPSRIPSGKLHLVDLSPNCIEFCKKRLASHGNVEYHVNDGRSLKTIADGTIDFVWSFDTFVHIEEPEIRSYAKELKRIMKRQSMGAIHHSGNPTPDQKRNGMRSEVGARKFGAILAEAGLYVIRQVSEWGNRCNFKLTSDCITVFARP